MWIIVEGTVILKVSIVQENENQIFVENCPSDLLGNPGGFRYDNGVVIEVVE